MTERRQTPRRQQILEALAREIELRPASRITTARLAGVVGVSEAALYRHFPGKAANVRGPHRVRRGGGVRAGEPDRRRRARFGAAPLRADRRRGAGVRGAERRNRACAPRRSAGGRGSGARRGGSAGSSSGSRPSSGSPSATPATRASPSEAGRARARTSWSRSSSAGYTSTARADCGAAPPRTWTASGR